VRQVIFNFSAGARTRQLMVSIDTRFHFFSLNAELSLRPENWLSPTLCISCRYTFPTMTYRASDRVSPLFNGVGFPVKA